MSKPNGTAPVCSALLQQAANVAVSVRELALKDFKREGFLWSKESFDAALERANKWILTTTVKVLNVETILDVSGAQGG